MFSEDKDNIFFQPEQILSLEFLISYSKLFEITETIDKYEVNYEYFEIKETVVMENFPDDLWRVKLYPRSTKELFQLENSLIKDLAKLSDNSIVIHRVNIPNEDWVKKVQDNFSPIEAGMFYIHGDQHPINKRLVNIKINPNRAFGTGEHQTTQLCLKAISYLKEQNMRFSNCFDLGCGSGILSIALQKAFNCRVTASDIDSHSVEVSKTNFLTNNSEINAVLANGFYKREIKQEAPFDLIASNILLKPLIHLEEQINLFSTKNAYIILSGFLEYQLDELKSTYNSEKYIIEREFSDEGWLCLLLKKTT